MSGHRGGRVEGPGNYIVRTELSSPKADGSHDLRALAPDGVGGDEARITSLLGNGFNGASARNKL